MIPIRRDELEEFKKLVPEKTHQTIDEAVAACNILVNKIEGLTPTTENWYGDYLGLIGDKHAAMVFILAGANKQGVASVLRIHGLI